MYSHKPHAGCNVLVATASTFSILLPFSGACRVRATPAAVTNAARRETDAGSCVMRIADTLLAPDLVLVVGRRNPPVEKASAPATYALINSWTCEPPCIHSSVSPCVFMRVLVYTGCTRLYVYTGLQVRCVFNKLASTTLIRICKTTRCARMHMYGNAQVL